jgi:hypothetical protein
MRADVADGEADKDDGGLQGVGQSVLQFEDANVEELEEQFACTSTLYEVQGFKPKKV